MRWQPWFTPEDHDTTQNWNQQWEKRGLSTPSRALFRLHMVLFFRTLFVMIMSIVGIFGSSYLVTTHSDGWLKWFLPAFKDFLLPLVTLYFVPVVMSATKLKSCLKVLFVDLTGNPNLNNVQVEQLLSGLHNPTSFRQSNGKLSVLTSDERLLLLACVLSKHGAFPATNSIVNTIDDTIHR